MTTTKAAPRRPVQARRLVQDIAARHFGEKARNVVERSGGLTNSVWQLRVSQGDFIVRTHANATKINDYLKEQWAMDAARAVGVPTPRVMEVGNFEDGRPYMISELAPGRDGSQARQRLPLLESIGRAAARLHTVRTHSFGPVFDWSSNELSRHATWAGWLSEGFGVERRLKIMKRYRMLSANQLRRLRNTGSVMARWRKPPVLQHGDMRLKNTIVDEQNDQLVALIDWENCSSSPAPFWDLSLALHDLGIDEKEAFLSGYGMRPRAFAEALHFMRFFNVLNYAHAVESAAGRNEHTRLEILRMRLRGDLDLYEA